MPASQYWNFGFRWQSHWSDGPHQIAPAATQYAVFWGGAFGGKHALLPQSTLPPDIAILKWCSGIIWRGNSGLNKVFFRLNLPLLDQPHSGPGRMCPFGQTLHEWPEPAVGLVQTVWSGPECSLLKHWGRTSPETNPKWKEGTFCSFYLSLPSPLDVNILTESSSKQDPMDSDKWITKVLHLFTTNQVSSPYDWR